MSETEAESTFSSSSSSSPPPSPSFFSNLYASSSSASILFSLLLFISSVWFLLLRSSSSSSSASSSGQNNKNNGKNIREARLRQLESTKDNNDGKEDDKATAVSDLDHAGVSSSCASLSPSGSSKFNSQKALRLRVRKYIKDSQACSSSSPPQVMLFSKSWCPFCDQVKELLIRAKDRPAVAKKKQKQEEDASSSSSSSPCLNLPGSLVRVIELDRIQDGDDMHKELIDLCGGFKTVPNVFIGGWHAGGCSDLVRILEEAEDRDGEEEDKDQSPPDPAVILQKLVLILRRQGKQPDSLLDIVSSDGNYSLSAGSSSNKTSNIPPSVSAEKVFDVKGSVNVKNKEKGTSRDSNVHASRAALKCSLERQRAVCNSLQMVPFDVTVNGETLYSAGRPLDHSAGGPEIRPLCTVEEWLSWQSGSDAWNVASVGLKNDKSGGGGNVQGKTKGRKLLVCHDMCGSYIEDKYPQGYECNISEVDRETFYRIYQWELIDTFVYFSHSLVTIPPSQWTNCAHRHGTAVLGTVITEHQKGMEICHEYLFGDRSSAEHFANQLVAIAVYYGFEGWLLNFENPIRPGLHMNNLFHFVEYLTNVIHVAIPNGQVIWYDSVVSSTGQLAWQNALNEHNMEFFKRSDGIFLNYGWKPFALGRNVQQAISCGRNAADVYVGIDCFGRGCHGGGGMNCDVAMQAIADAADGRSTDLSAALFAPGWVYENLSKDSLQLERNLKVFWNKLRPFFSCRPYDSIPFRTNFSEGVGERFFVDGNLVGSDIWMNYSLQTFMPNITSHPLFEVGGGGSSSKNEEAGLNLLPNPLKEVGICYYQAVNGGSSLKLYGRYPPTPIGGFKDCKFKRCVLRIFKTDLRLGEPITVEYTFKSTSSAGRRTSSAKNKRIGIRVYLQLVLNRLPENSGNTDADLWYVILSGASGHSQSSASDGAAISPVLARTKDSMSLGCMEESRLAMVHCNGNECNNGWITRRFNLDHPQLRFRRVEEVRVVCLPYVMSQEEEYLYDQEQLKESTGGVGLADCEGVMAVRMGEIKLYRTEDMQMGDMMKVKNIRVVDTAVHGEELTTLLWDYEDIRKTSPGDTSSRMADSVECFDVYAVESPPVADIDDGKDKPKGQRIFIGRAYVTRYCISKAKKKQLGKILGNEGKKVRKEDCAVHFGIQAISVAGFKSPLFVNDKVLSSSVSLL
eukprot:Nk52_evm3s2325 gene=Nk52_evmTU3s2325